MFNPADDVLLRRGEAGRVERVFLSIRDSTVPRESLDFWVNEIIVAAEGLANSVGIDRQFFVACECFDLLF